MVRFFSSLPGACAPRRFPPHLSLLAHPLQYPFRVSCGHYRIL